MIRMMRAAMRGIKAELAAGESGWVALSGDAIANDFGLKSDAGPMVSGESIMRLSSAWSCIRATSQLIASLPCDLVEKQSDGSTVKIDDPLCDIVTVKPNLVQTGPEYMEGVVSQILTRGNAYSEKLYVGPRLVGLRPLMNVRPRKRNDGQFEYHINDRGITTVMPPEKVFHLRNFGSGDGLGLSAIKYGVQSFGSALAADEAAAAVFANGLTPSGIVSADQTLTPEQRDQLQKMLAVYAGSKKAGKVIALEGGLKWTPVAISPEDAQLLETRRFQVEDICRWFGVPPIIIGHAAEGQTMWGTGVEAIMLSWLTIGINPFLRRIEARMRADLIPAERRGRLKFEFNREAMLQMDSKAKGEFLSKMGQSGTMSANERRAKLNLPRDRDPAADLLLAQTALAPLADLRKDT